MQTVSEHYPALNLLVSEHLIRMEARFPLKCAFWRMPNQSDFSEAGPRTYWQQTEVLWWAWRVHFKCNQPFNYRGTATYSNPAPSLNETIYFSYCDSNVYLNNIYHNNFTGVLGTVLESTSLQESYKKHKYRQETHHSRSYQQAVKS